MTRRQSLFIFIILSTFLSLPVFAQGAKKSSPPPLANSHRIIVKLSNKMAPSLESSMTSATMEIQKDTASSNAALFFSKYRIKKMMPVFKEIVAWKKRTGRTEMDLLSGIKIKYAQRTQRFRGVTNPSALSQIYIVEPENSTEQTFQETLKSLKIDPNVEYAEREQIVTVQMIPNDPYFSSNGSWGQSYDDLPGIKSINAPSAWDISTGRGITVAVVDTGIDKTHPDIAANTWANTDEIPGNGIDDDKNGYVDDSWGWNFVEESKEPIDDHGHGTHVAGTIAAVGNNGIGVIGVAPDAKVMAVKCMNKFGSGYETWLANAITYAANNGADIINLSIGGKGHSSLVEDAVNYAHGLGVVVVVAAGNDAENVRDYYPAGCNNAITVAATKENNEMERADFSNWGNKIDVIAPGSDILSLRASDTSLGLMVVGSDYVLASGTSMAAPHVAGVAALIMAKHPEFSNEQVRQILHLSAIDWQKYKTVNSKNVLWYQGYDLLTGAGRIDAFKAVSIDHSLEVQIDSPQDGSLMIGEAVIRGSAKGLNFAGYKLSYGSGYEPVAWTTIQQGDVPIDMGILGIFDGTAVPDGVYTLRLTAHDSINPEIIYEYRMELEVNYMEITSPSKPRVPTVAKEYKGGLEIPIEGTANGPGFQRFYLEWAEGYKPTNNWNSNGFTLEGNGTSQVSNGKLATWDSSVINGKPGFYQIRLLVDNDNFISESRTFMYVEPDLASSNWPRLLDNNPGDRNSILVASDGIGRNNLVLNIPQCLGTTVESSLKRFSWDGTLLSSMDYTTSYYMQPPLADLDGNAGDEVVFRSEDPSYDIFRIVKPDNTWFEFSSHSPFYFQSYPITLQDMDGDSIPEILCIGRDLTNRTQTLFVWRQDGTLLYEGCPSPIINDKTVIETKNRFLAVDFDCDGKKEIVLIQGDTERSSSLKLYNWDGTSRIWSGSEPIFPNGVIQEIIAGDLERDGQVDLILSVVESAPSSSTESVYKIYLLNADGSVKTGWPVTLSGVCDTIKIADMDRDGTDEVVCSSGSIIEVLKLDGSLFRNVYNTAFKSFSIGDVNGDTYPEIVGVSFDGNGDYSPDPEATYQFRWYQINRLKVVDINSYVLKSWEILGLNDEQAYLPKSAPVLGDFDKNGKVDIAITYSLIDGGGISGWLFRGGISVYALDADYNPEYMDWPTNFYDPQNSSVKLPKPLITKIELDKASYLVQIGMIGKVIVTAQLSNHTVKNVTQVATYQMDNQGIATIDSNGMIHGLALGTTTLMVTWEGQTATAQINVEEYPYVTVSGTTVAEGNGGTINAVFTVTLHNGNNQTVSVDYATADGTAKAGVDYEAKTGVINFAPGITNQTVNVAVIGDMLSEGNETFYFNLSGGVNVEIPDAKVMATIIDDDPLPSLTVIDAVVNEGPADKTTTALLKVALSAVSGQTVTVDYATVDSTASAGQDYQSQTGTLTFSPGTLTNTISVVVNGDVLDETNEKCYVNLSNPVGATISNTLGSITITDDDPTPTITITDAVVTEGNEGTTEAVITVTLSKISGRTVTVNFATADGTAKAGSDYKAQQGNLTFTPGTTIRKFIVPVLGDTVDEGNESFAINFSGAIGAVLSTTQSNIVIADDDPLPGLSVEDVTIMEGDSGTLSAIVAVTLSSPTSKKVKVNYTTANGIAKADRDYIAKTGVLTFAPGVTTRKISVPIIGEHLCENDETLVVNLSSPVNAVLTNAQGVVTIADNDPLPSLRISDAKITEGNAGTVKAVVTVTLSAVCGRTVSVNYRTVDDTAKAGVDYTAKTGTIEFAPGTTSRTISVLINPDTIDEYNNKCNVHLADAVNAVIGDADGTVTIVDDDAAVTLSIRDATFLEGNEGTVKAIVTVSLSKISGKTVTANYATANGSAKSGSDYLAQTGTVIFATGERTKTITLTVSSDLIDESNEKFYINLSGITNAVCTDPQGAVIITDDDATPYLFIDDVTVTEGNSRTTYALFTVTLSAASGKTVAVKYATVNGTAKANYDYTAKTGTLTFVPGVTTQTIKVAVKGETLKEKDESFSVALSGAVNAILITSAGLGVIINDDV